jgi:putative endonuclease
MARGRTGLGRRGESLAAQALQQGGYTVVERNWYCPYGEVDLVAECGEDLYFVEVRTRRASAYPTPEQSLTQRKHTRMEMVARAYLGTHATRAPLTWHLSFVAVALDRAGRLRRITFYPDLTGQPQELLQHP